VYLLGRPGFRFDGALRLTGAFLAGAFFAGGFFATVFFAGAFFLAGLFLIVPLFAVHLRCLDRAF
jgi:hypothetical protein